jgi:aspartyl protease family protein
MNGLDIGNMIYLVLLGVVIGGYLLVANRHQMGKIAQQAAIWVFIFLGAIVVAGMWGDIANTVMPRQSVAQDGTQIIVPRATDGHYYVTLDLNGVPIRFVVDTGASEMVLTQADALRAGVDMSRLIFSGRAMTANGMVETAPVTLDTVTLGGVSDARVRATVNGGEMAESLLGMSYLHRFSRLEFANGKLMLER